jgi:hypothetical protein
MMSENWFRDWGQWHHGGRYSVRTGYSEHNYDSEGEETFRVGVEIKDNTTGETIRRVGRGEMIGNFSPIWVSIGGKKYQLTELLRMD